MNYPALNPIRNVVFNPCFASGDKLTGEVAHAGSEIIGLANGNPRGDGTKLVRNTPMGEAYQMLEAVGARFDLIVSAPPAGTIPAKGLPKPARVETGMVKPAGRKLFMADAAPAAAPEIDLGYATWLVTNALLSPFGEALLIVNDASYALIKADANFSRVWAYQKTPAPTPDLPTYWWLYIARDHRPRFDNAPVHCEPYLLQKGNRCSLRGTVITVHAEATPDSVKKFLVVRDEVSHKALSESTNDFNVLLDNNKVRLRFSPFAIESGAIPRQLVTSAEELLLGKTLLDLAIMRDTRDRVTAILADKRLKIANGLIKGFDDACGQLAILSAPFSRPSPMQRVAWLDEQDTVECTRDFGPFKAGEHYLISTRTITGR